MLSYGTKVNNSPNSADGTLTAEEWNGLTTELKNVVTSSGQTVSSGDTFQMAESIATYAIAGAYYLDSGTANVYTLTLPGSRKGPAAYTDGMKVRFFAANTNTTSCTANAAGLGSKAIKRLDGTNLPADSILAGAGIELTYRLSLDYWILSQYVNSTGAQTIFDKKTFDTVPASLADPASGNDLSRKSYVDAQIAALPVGNFPTGYKGSAPPVWASSTTFTVDALYLRDTTDVINIKKTTSTTINLATTGLNGIAQSSNLTGTVSVSNASNTVTFSSTQAGVLQVGDVITTAGGNSRRLISGAGASWVAESNWSATETTVTVKRGGLAPNTHYHLYGICKAAGLLPGYILTTRNLAAGDTLVDFPTDYTLWAQEAFSCLNMTTGGVMPFRVGAGWPRRPFIALTNMETASNVYQISNAFSTNAFTTINTNAVVPANSRLINLDIDPTHSGGGFECRYFVRETGSGLSTGRFVTEQASAGFFVQSIVTNVAVSSTQQLDLKASVSGGTPINVYVSGYTITEVK